MVPPRSDLQNVPAATAGTTARKKTDATEIDGTQDQDHAHIRDRDQTHDHTPGPAPARPLDMRHLPLPDQPSSTTSKP